MARGLTVPDIKTSQIYIKTLWYWYNIWIDKDPSETEQSPESVFYKSGNVLMQVLLAT